MNYIILRLYRTLKNKGIIGLVKSILNYLNSKLNPSIVGEFPFKYLFIKKRRLLKKFAKQHLDDLDDIRIITFGNYLIREDLINLDSVIYSFGVGNSISFEEKISAKFGCKIYCYDPTSIATDFMNNYHYDKNKIIYNCYGIWIEDKKVKFFAQNEKNQTKRGGSITNLFESQKYDLLQCYTLGTLMSQNNHSNIDLVKLDIEGAGIDVIDNFVSQNIFPKQIIAEFEYSENEYIDQKKFSEWENKLMSLINKLKRNHYKCYYLPRYSHIPYSTIEVLFVNTDNY